MRDLLAFGFSIPGRTSQRGMMGRRRDVSHITRPRLGLGFDGIGWVQLDPVGARQVHIWSHMSLYISCAPIQVSRVICQGLLGFVRSYRVPTGFHWNPDLARKDPICVDGSLSPVSVHH